MLVGKNPSTVGSLVLVESSATPFLKILKWKGCPSSSQDRAADDHIRGSARSRFFLLNDFDSFLITDSECHRSCAEESLPGGGQKKGPISRRNGGRSCVPTAFYSVRRASMGSMAEALRAGK